jgi:hypothetical protein
LKAFIVTPDFRDSCLHSVDAPLQRQSMTRSKMHNRGAWIASQELGGVTATKADAPMVVIAAVCSMCKQARNVGSRGRAGAATLASQYQVDDIIKTDLDGTTDLGENSGNATVT